MPLLSQMLPFLAFSLVIRDRHEKHAANLDAVLKDSPILFFGTLLVGIVPNSFLTYLDHIPNRNTYFPTVGLAAINGILFAATYAALRSVRARRLAVMFLSLVIVRRRYCFRLAAALRSGTSLTWDESKADYAMSGR